MYCTNKQYRLLGLLAGLLALPAVAIADVDITNVTVVPGSVVAGNTVDVTVDAETDGGGGVDNWMATNITLILAGQTPVQLFCADVPAYDGDGNYTWTFTGLTVPVSTPAGNWTVRVRVYTKAGECAKAPGGNDDEDTSETLEVIEPECSVDADCDDGLFCNGAETCDGGLCADGTPPVVDDGVDCTIDSCDEENDEIDHDPNDAYCDDGAFCNGAEICDVVNDCQAGTPPEVDDGVDCTIDSCDEENDEIDHDPDDTYCDDDQFCNGEETCDVINDCQAGTPPDVDDGVDCTIDSCDEDNDEIDHDPSDAFCDDDLFCNGAETCDVVNDCQAGTPPEVDDGVSCTDDYCDEENDEIVNDPNDDNCNQASNECSLADTCDPVNDCQLNNIECGSVTSSSLCQFDVAPDKGTCFDGDENLGQACSDDGDCDLGTCEQTDQFRLGFSPDMQNWVSYKQNASNPGQFYYNVMYQMADFGDFLVMSIPYPFVTQGATPVHVYDANTVGTDEAGCLDPENALFEVHVGISMDDWLNGTEFGNEDWYLLCPEVADPGAGAGQVCELGIWIPDAAASAAEGFMYANIHLDFGLKGPAADADGNLLPDRYDRGGFISPWGSSDALENDTDNVWIEDCSTFEFSHVAAFGPGAGEDSVENLNAFKKPAGAFGAATCDDTSTPLTGWVGITKVGSAAILSVGMMDEDGFFGVDYGHKGKAAEYQLHWCADAACSTTVGAASAPFWMQANGFVEIHLLDEDTDAACDGSSPNLSWSDPIYASGKFK